MTNETNAANAYAKRRSDIARLLDVLDMELDKHGQAERTWAREADLAKVRSDLIDLVGFVSRMERAEVERFLNDAE